MEGTEYPAQGSQLDYYVGQRVNTDFITDPGMAVLLSIITCGIYFLYLIYKLVQRRDEHFKRMAGVADAAIAQLRVKAQGRENLIAPELQQLEQCRMQMQTMAAERGAAIWLLICIFTGVGQFILWYLLMQDYEQHEAVEFQFFTLMSSALSKLGLAGEAGQAVPVMPHREFVTYLLLSIVTCCIYLYYWLYVMVKDFNEHMTAQVGWEDFLVTALR
jgi:Domain of unknown function (DUF4234)